MEKSEPDAQFASPETSRPKDGLIKRWQNKLKPEAAGPVPEQAEPKKPLKERVRGLLARVAIVKSAETKPPQANAEQSQPQPRPEVAQASELTALKDFTRKFGRNVLTFAGDVLKKVQKDKSENVELKQSTDELKQSRRHLREELAQLDETPVYGGESGGDYAPSTVKERVVERAERQVAPKKSETIGDIASTAILAMAGAGIFMATLDSGERKHIKEHVKSKKLRRRFARFLERQQTFNEQQQAADSEQSQLIARQQAELDRLKAEKSATTIGEKVSFVQEVSDFTEQQAVATHQVVDRLKGSEPNVQFKLPELEQGRAEVQATGAGGESVQADRASATGGGQNGGAAGFGDYPTSLSNATKSQLQQKLKTQQVQKQLDQKVRSAWTIVVLFATLAVATGIWLVQVVISG